jgi:hypothetical protein
MTQIGKVPWINADERGLKFRVQILLICDNPVRKPKMHIDYTISAQDYASAQRLAIKRMKPFQGRLIQWLPSFGLLLLGFILYAGFRRGFSTSLAPGLFVAFFMLAVWFTTRQAIRKSYTTSSNMHGQLSLDIDDNGLRFYGRTFDSQVAWDHYFRFFEDKNSFVLLQNPSIFNIIPKGCLSAEQTTVMKDLLARHITNSN